MDMILVNKYRVSAETILFWIWPYVLWPLVTVHKSAKTIQGRKLFAEIRYYGGRNDTSGSEQFPKFIRCFMTPRKNIILLFGSEVHEGSNPIVYKAWLADNGLKIHTQEVIKNWVILTVLLWQAFVAAQDTEYTMWDQNYFEVPFDISLGFYLGGFHLQLLEFPYVYQFYSRNKKTQLLCTGSKVPL